MRLHDSLCRGMIVVGAVSTRGMGRTYRFFPTFVALSFIASPFTFGLSRELSVKDHHKWHKEIIIDDPRWQGSPNILSITVKRRQDCR